MIYLHKYSYFFLSILACMASEHENVPPMSGFYTDGLDQALDKIEIVYPERVSKDGSFVSYYLPHYYNIESLENRPKRTADGSEESSGDAIHFFVPIEGEKHHLELWPNLNFLAPGLVIEKRDARDVENINKAKISQISQKQCHYNGRIVGKPDSRAALSTCYGLAGYIQLPAGEEYLIEPVKDSKPAFNKEHPHIMYKRSGIKDRHGNSNCLTKGTAKEALGERLAWESIFGNQVRKDLSGVNMNDVVRDAIAKSPQDDSKSMSSAVNTNTANNAMNINPIVNQNVAVSPQQEKMAKENEIKLNEESVQPMKNLQNNVLRNENYFERNVQPSDGTQHDISADDRLGKYKFEYGNKLKQKPLKEELGSIKLPDVNLSPLKPSSSHPTDSEHFMNKPIYGTPNYEKERRLYETDFEQRRVKRDLQEDSNNLKPELKTNADVKTIVNQRESLKRSIKHEQNFQEQKVSFPSQSNSQFSQNVENSPNEKISDFETDLDVKQIHLSKRDLQNNQEKAIFDQKNSGNIDGKVNQNMLSSEYNNKLVKRDDVNSVHSNLFNNDNLEGANVKEDIKQDDVSTKQNNLLNNQMLNPELINKVNHKYSFSNIENNVKRDIHLDTSEKSWKSENNKKPNSEVIGEPINYAYNTDKNSKCVNDRSETHKNKNKISARDLQRVSESPKISNMQKTNTNNEDEIMSSALESVVRDMDKTKVKKDVLGGFSYAPPEGKSPKKQPVYSKVPVKYSDVKYMKLDETQEQSPVQTPGDTVESDRNTKMFEVNPKTGADLIKESRPSSELSGEPIQAPKAYVEKPDQNHVDEIIIRIKTPEGTVSEVKHNYETDRDNLRNDNIEPIMNNEDSGSKHLGLVNDRNKLLAKTNIKPSDAEKSKRGVDGKSEREEVDKTNNMDPSKNYQEISAEDLNIILEAAQQNSMVNGGSTKNKFKRDDNTIHLVIETEPEVKSPENHNSESPNSNLFCQGKNCLEIKPVFLNDTKVAVVSSNNSNIESPKEKIVEKRDAIDTSTEDDEFCGLTTTEPPLRCQDFAHKVFNLELMITVDYKVVQMHDDDDIENFILTIINMVSSNFDDKSIGLNMNVVLVRLILLTTCIKELDSDRFNPEELLENFCTWQVLVNPGRDDHPHHHDLAIFVSKMDKCEGQVMGVSYMTSVCRPDKACIICVDEGLLLANTITHQIGHSLGADHDDGQSTGCAAKLPDGTSYHMAPTITETSSSWSVCSRDAIIQFVRTQGSWCLIDFPVIRSYNFPLMLPGQIYSAAQQCKLNFHMTAIPCSVGPFCNKLYCQITDKLCATKGDPPADGTFCASNMWCFHKQCVHVGRRPGAINGEWGPWTEWSLCTRSCGGGVSSSYRICNNPKPENGGRYCIGERMRHRICQTKPCQGFTESFRDLQCKRTEDRPFRGKIHNWVQYQSLFINIECALVCQNRKGDVVMRSPIVADGTPCKAGTQNVCIQGICRSVGCDYVIDSNAKEDACGVCHGNGTECRIIQGVFDEAIAKKGLIEFLRIPKDSGMIFVREVAPSTNTLVVSGSINRVFYLNGLGSEDSMAGDVAFGVTHGVYEKRGGMERIFIRGPTKEDLIFYVLFRSINKGIHYQYATLEYDPTYIPRYLWQYLDWDACSDPCSGGSQRARAKCVEDRGGVVDDKYCTESSRPLDIVRPCNDFPCQAKWWVSVWSDCICTGATSVMFRSVLCMRANDESGTRVEVVKESECSLAKKPPTQKPCNFSEEDTDCAKRSIPDDAFFRAHRDLRRAVNPRVAFSAFSPTDSDGSIAQEPSLLSESSFDESNKQGYSENKNLKKPKTQINKNANSKGSANKPVKPNIVEKGLSDKKKPSLGTLQEINNNLKPVDLSKNIGTEEHKIYIKNENLPLQSKGRQIVKLNQKNSAALSALKSELSNQAADENDIGSKDYEGKGVSECESSTATGTCPTEENTSETPTTCKETCAPLPHKKTTCCKTTPHRQYVVKTTMETTTIRPVAIKLDELNVNNFALTVVPLEFSGKKKLLPQSDPEFIHLGSVGQFGVADELNATVITGQEALDLLEFARSNASEEPVILHEDMHN